ncbi:hypothetical protein AcW1_006738 [Taiwanofungus camphoratus]|nr:hypothetical protein AcV7_007329 [Antrodia cinnamomea]KAI0955029.1 hypothetical protein AcW1_006738 [Antrodia cinnamomea]
MLSRRLESILGFVCIVFLATNAIYKLVGLLWVRNALNGDRSTDSDLWIVERGQVQLKFDNYIPYGLDSELEWSALVPGNGLVYVGTNHQPFMVSMMHQLRCIDVVRAQLVKKEYRQMDMARHCMNYIRQMILCRGDTFLDPYQYPSKINPLDPHPVRRCLDWRAVYEAAENNQQEHVAWLNTNYTG